MNTLRKTRKPALREYVTTPAAFFRMPDYPVPLMVIRSRQSIKQPLEFARDVIAHIQYLTMKGELIQQSEQICLKLALEAAYASIESVITSIEIENTAVPEADQAR
jgi:hypothetical protein